MYNYGNKTLTERPISIRKTFDIRNNIIMQAAFYSCLSGGTFLRTYNTAKILPEDPNVNKTKYRK